MDWIMPLIAGLGIGSILKTIIDSYILRRNFIKDRYYNEKKQSYLNLIESLYLINVDHSTKNLKKFGLYSIHCQLFGHKQVYDLTKKLMETSLEPELRNKIINKMIEEMKKDLQK